MDIVIPYIQSTSNELLYTLRSLKNLPHEGVFIIGDKPNLEHGANFIYYKQTKFIAQNTLNIIDMACEDERISKDFILMHDDMFVMEPIEKLPIYHRGTYKDVIANYEDTDAMSSWYTKRMQDTHDRLVKWGIAEPLCYEVHVPFVINKKTWKILRPLITEKLNKISMYANIAHLGGEKLEYDVKVKTDGRIPEVPFISTHEETFEETDAGKLIMETFK